MAQQPSPFRHADSATSVMGGISEFSLNMYNEISPNADNIFISPASIVLALSMTYLGARGSTSSQMKSVLKFEGVEDDHIHGTMADLLELLSLSGDCKLHTANRLYGEGSYSFLDGFIGSTKEKYKAALEAVNFKGDHEQARLAINSWVKEQTANKITELLPAGVVDPLTRLVLVNAIYFKGNWNSQFDEAKTAVDKFYTSDTDFVQVKMMKQKAIFPMGYNKDLQAQAIEIPYTDPNLSMVIILPKNKTGLPALEAQIKASHIADIKGAFKMMKGHNKITLSLPKFSLSESSDLKSVLTKLGMTDLFGDGADLSGIDGSRMLYVAAVMHSAHIEVNEEGTEAAAATAVVANYRSMPMEITFKADHPFMFVILDNRSKLPLFLGRLAKPEALAKDEL